MVSNFVTQNCCYVAAYGYACKDNPLTDILHNPGRSEMSNIHLLSQKKKKLKNSNQVLRKGNLLQQTQK